MRKVHMQPAATQRARMRLLPTLRVRMLPVVTPGVRTPFPLTLAVAMLPVATLGAHTPGHQVEADSPVHEWSVHTIRRRTRN